MNMEEEIKEFYKEMNLSKDFKKKLQDFEELIRKDEREKVQEEMEVLIKGG